jgi:hypothetical protein
MKLKKEYIILAAVIIVLSLYLFFYNRDHNVTQLPKLPEVKAIDMTKIQIQKPDLEINLVQEDSRWYILPQKYPADKDRVNGILETIEGLTVTALISESKSYQRYQLDDANRITVKAWAGDALKREFSIGKPVPASRHTFIKLPDNESVFHARGNFKSRFDKTVDTLRDKKVFAFETSEADKIEIIQEEKSLLLKRHMPKSAGDAPKEKEAAEDKKPKEVTDIKWLDGEGQAADKSTVTDLLNSLARLECEAFIQGKSKNDFTKTIYRVTIQGKKAYTLSVFAKEKKEEEQYPAVSSESDYPFMLSQWQAENIMKKPEEIMNQKKSE